MVESFRQNFCQRVHDHSKEQFPKLTVKKGEISETAVQSSNHDDVDDDDDDKEEKEEIEIDRKVPITKTSSKFYQCRYCDKKLSTSQKRINHQRQHTLGLRLFECTLCHQRFDNLLGCKMHQRTFHNFLEMKDGLITKHSEKYCKECSMAFKSLDEYKSHLKLRHKKLFYHSCKFCQRVFICNWQVKRHELIHTGGKGSKKCGICGKGLKHSDQLRRHLMDMHKLSRKDAEQRMRKFEENENHTENVSENQTSNVEKFNIKTEPEVSRGRTAVVGNDDSIDCSEPFSQADVKPRVKV